MNLKNNSNFFERINLIIDEYGLKNVSGLAKSLGYTSPEKLNRLKKEEAKPSFDILIDISNKFENLNAKWLLTGTGPMLKNDHQPIMVRELRTDYAVEKQDIPLYDLVASAGVTEIFGESNLSVPLDYIRVPNLPKCDGALYVRGDSMYPLLKAGDIVMYKILHDKTQIIWGEMYLCHLICNGDEYFFTKFIKRGDREGYALFVSQNQHHQPVEFPIDCIQSLALVKASIRINTQI